MNKNTLDEAPRLDELRAWAKWITDKNATAYVDPATLRIASCILALLPVDVLGERDALRSQLVTLTAERDAAAEAARFDYAFLSEHCSKMERGGALCFAATEAIRAQLATLTAERDEAKRAVERLAPVVEAAKIWREEYREWLLAPAIASTTGRHALPENSERFARTVDALTEAEREVTK